MKRIILASSSPRRSMLLRQIGLPFEVEPSNIDETNVDNLPAEKLVAWLSKTKAEKIFQKNTDAIVVGADTMVVLGKEIIGKPSDKKDAVTMLSKLSGKTHRVITGLTVMDSKKILTRHMATDVLFKKLSKKEIEDYVATGEPLDKAGGYGIQEKGVLLIEKVIGDYPNVVGLPILLLIDMLKEFEVEISSFWKNR